MFTYTKLGSGGIPVPQFPESFGRCYLYFCDSFPELLMPLFPKIYIQHLYPEIPMEPTQVFFQPASKKAQGAIVTLMSASELALACVSHF